MKIIVLKFGGTSVGTLDRIVKISKIIVSYIKKKYKVIVVTSAMSGVTNDLIEKAEKISKNFPNSERDVLLSTGEQMASALIPGKLCDLGFTSRSWMSWQIPIITRGNYSAARIIKIGTNQLKKYLKKGGTPIITGFQGLNKESRLTTLERGGSDASAIMLAKFFKAKRCIIYTDVDGVYTTDPNLTKKAKKIKALSYEEMLEMSSLGAKVMQPASIQDAKLNKVKIDVKSSFTNKTGTQIVGRKKIKGTNIIRGVSFTKNDAKVSLLGVKDKPGVAAAIFEPLYKNSINVDMVIQNISADGKKTDLTFTIKRHDKDSAASILKENKKIKYENIQMNDKVSKISIVGAGMVATPGVTYKMFRSLAEEKINILAISTSEIKVSVIIDEEFTIQAVKKLHKTFKLD